MRKLYSLVLMAAALLIGTNAQAVSDWAGLKAAMEAGGTVTLSNDINVTYADAEFQSIWIGASTLTGDAPATILDLAGHNITIYVQTANSVNPFVLTKGSLKVTGAGKIEVTGTSNVPVAGKDYTTGYPLPGTNVFSVFGADDANKVDPRTAPFSRLEIDENVEVKTKNGTVIAIDLLKSSHAALAKVVPPAGKTKPSYNTDSKAYGAFVEVKGKLTSQGADYYSYDSKGKDQGRKCYGIKVNGSVTKPDVEADRQYIPYVHVDKKAVITSDMRANLAGSAAAYSSGYGRWLIEGTCNGASGVYVSAGIVDINGGKIKSGADYDPAGGGGHANGSGNAITVNSRSGYPGDAVVNVSGEAEVTSTNGFALEETVTSAGQTELESITISGGTFQGNNEVGTIAISEASKTEPEIVVTGGVFAGNVETLIAAADNKDQIINQVVSQEGSTAVVVIGTKDPTDDVVTPETDEAKEEFVFVNNMANDIVKLDAENEPIAKLLPAGVTEVKYLSLTGSGEHTSTVTVEAGKTLKVGQIVMNANGRIIVKPGAKLLVTGENGIFASNVENLVLETTEGNSSIFLLNPDVKGNKNPSATVEFISKSFTAGSNFAKQRFGIPTNSAVLSMTTKYDNADVQTALSKFDYAANKWVDFGWINIAGKDENLDQLSNPFEYYQMQHNTPNLGTVVVMKGALVGNENPELSIRGNFWNGFANSYMAPIDGKQLISMIPNTVDKAFFMYDITADHATWESYTLMNIDDQGGIQPMQPFLIRNTKEAAEVAINYEAAVYNPAMGIAPNPAGAPRRAASNMTKAKLIVKGENCIDRVIVAEDAQFSAEFDNGYDAAKYMNDGINMYVSADEKMSIFATDNLNNTYVGFQAMNGGNYTMEFANVQGEELTLIDHETGARVAMVEGGVYEFTANGTNDYRFEIVNTVNAPTAIENTEAVKSAKGIYTITGQFVGEMNVWNTLPAGIYVVNGEKLVK